MSECAMALLRAAQRAKDNCGNREGERGVGRFPLPLPVPAFGVCPFPGPASPVPRYCPMCPEYASASMSPLCSDASVSLSFNIQPSP